MLRSVSLTRLQKPARPAKKRESSLLCNAGFECLKILNACNETYQSDVALFCVVRSKVHQEDNETDGRPQQREEDRDEQVELETAHSAEEIERNVSSPGGGW